MIKNVTSTSALRFDNDTEVAAIRAASSFSDDILSLAPPLVLNHPSGLVNGWGYYFAHIIDGAGFSRELQIQDADMIGGSTGQDLHLAVWSPDPHSDDWRPIPFDEIEENVLKFSGRLPNRGRFAVTRVPGYTLTRVYRMTEKYRRHPLVSATPSAPSGVHAMQVSPPDWRGQEVPDLPMPAYMIGDGDSGKTTVVLSAGNHAYECHADYNLEGSIEFLLSSDSIANTLRANCNFYVYPTINPAGRFCGYARANPELKAAGLHDHNRIWGSSDRDTTSKLKAAFDNDFGGECDVLIDYHTFFFDTTSSNRGLWGPNEVSNGTFMAAVSAREPDTTVNLFYGSTNPPIETILEYAIDGMGATVAVHSEECALARRNVTEYRVSGKALMQGIYDMFFAP